jgi:DNA-binding response OmpR family regulator
MAALTLLLVQGKGVADDAVAALARSARVQLFRAPELRSSPTAFARRSARATVVATLDDPLHNLVYTRTSGFTGPLILAIDPRHDDAREDLLGADVLGVLGLPIIDDELNGVLDIVARHPPPPMANEDLGLFLDAIDRTARHGESVIRLTPREFALLHCLIGSGSLPVTVREIYDYVWGGQRSGDAMHEIVHVNISQLRKKLSQIGLKDAIHTIRDFGYGMRSSDS